jgi:hypothetical protein
MTREEMEEKMDELARKYIETHDKKIIEELYELARELEKIDKERRGRGSFWPSLALRKRSCEWQSTFVQTLYRGFTDQ